MRGIVLWHLNIDAAIRRGHVEAAATPALAAKLYEYPAVRRPAAEVPSHVTQEYTAVLRLEFRGSVDARDRNASVINTRRDNSVAVAVVLGTAGLVRKG